MFAGVRASVDALKPSRLFLLAFLPLWALYLATAASSLPYHIDPFTNVLTAWSFATTGEPYIDQTWNLSSPEHFGNIAWMVPAGDHTVSQYPPGAALIAVPFYLLDSKAEEIEVRGTNYADPAGVSVPVPSLAVAALVSSLATALAMGLLALTFRTAASGIVSLGGAYVAGIGTGAWSVASNALWQHGPAMLWIGLGIYFLSRDRERLGGLALAAAILTRPLTAVIAASAGIWLSIEQRSFRPALRVGVSSSVGLGALIAYNWSILGAPTISGGYGPAFANSALHSGIGWYAQNVLGALVDPTHGLLIWAPFLVVLMPGFRRAWQAAPPWIRGAAIGGLIYFLVQFKANRFSGGDGHFAYRYPLEALVAAAPLFLFAWREWVNARPVRRRLFGGAVLLAIAGQALGAVLY